MAKKQENALRFDRDALLQSDLFAHRKDALMVVMNEEEELTVDEAQERIDNFMKERA